MPAGRLSMRDITKRYPGVVALDGVSIEVEPGETHALVGENGAGKSTLMKVLAGAIAPDSGEVSLDGEAFSSMSPRVASELGISIIYQEFNDLPTLSVAENIFISDLPRRRGLVDHRTMVRRAGELLHEIGVDIDPATRARDLSVAHLQLVEIVKAIHRQVKVLVMDEPTAPLTPSEAETLFGIMAGLKRRGVTIIYISHRLGEIFRLADRVTVLRDGRKVSTHDIAGLTRDSLIRAMVGREITESSEVRAEPSSEPVLRVENLSGPGVKATSFEIRRGEVLGVFGLVGAGRTELARLIFGAAPKTSGRILLDGRELRIDGPREAVRQGIALIPEDRKHQGVIQSMTIGANISLPNLTRISRFGLIHSAAERNLVSRQMTSLKVAAPSSAQLVRNLSGGNQQKVVLAKWLAASARVLIFDEPTRGIDVAAKQEIYHLINELCDAGLSILMISSEMEEIIRMSDRVLVLCEGRTTGVLDRSEVSQEALLSLAARH